jgi:hypothetical protein
MFRVKENTLFARIGSAPLALAGDSHPDRTASCRRESSNHRAFARGVYPF